LEEAGFLISQWEHPKISQAEPRPARKYYELTRAGREALADALKRYRILEPQGKKVRQPKPSRA
jgi:DNA-binding PadR family transcriptional regulator